MKAAIVVTGLLGLQALMALAALAALAAAPGVAQAPAAPPPIADFFRRPVLSDPQLSPDGKRIAMRIAVGEGRTVLAVADTATPQNRVVIARFEDGDVRSFHWVNDKRLVFDAIDYQTPMGEQFGRGLYAVDVDGSNFMFLVGRGRDFESTGHVAMRPLRWNHVFEDVYRDGSDDVLVVRHDLRHRSEAGSTTLLRLNTRTRGTRELVANPPDHVADWVLDRAGVARAAVSIDLKGHARVLLRDAADAPWSEIDSYSIYDVKARSIVPRAFDADGSLVTIAPRGDEEGTLALFRYDIGRRKLADAPFLALKGYDFNGELIFDSGSRRLVGASYVSDSAGAVWLDPGLKALQERIDALLPATANQLLCGHACTSQPQYLVAAWSDRQSTLYFLFNPARQGKDSLVLVGARRPWLDAAKMAEQEVVRVSSSDGQNIPTYLTRPHGKPPWPAVVLVHGGPYVRGVTWEWRSQAQFLASRGYLVIEPEMRGSRGYGLKWFKAGWKQWGLKMQDDIADVARWAAAKGLADPARMAIAGASYGGYAAMMGVLKNPELFRAGINWVGVTDIELLYTIDWSDIDDTVWQRYGMPKLVGHPEADRRQFEATSPLKRAAEITRPVLMAYGGLDRRVPLPHGTKMRDALRAAGKVEVEWVEYPDEGHGFMLDANQFDFWGRVERFLARHLK